MEIAEIFYVYMRDGVTTFVFLGIGEPTTETSVMLTTLTTPTTTPTSKIHKVYPAG